MTTYTGSLTVSGHLTDNYGDSYDITGTIQVTSRLTLEAAGAIAMSSDFSGAMQVTAHLFNGTTQTNALPLSSYGVTSLTSLSNFNVPLGPVSDQLGGSYTETDSFNADRTRITITGLATVYDVESMAAYGLSDLVLTGTADIAGTLTGQAAHYSITPVYAPPAEGNGGTTPYIFQVIRAGDSTGPGTIAWSVQDTGSAPGNATAADFAGGVLPSGTISFAAGQAIQTITVNVAGDTTPEPDEHFVVALSNPPGALTLIAPDVSTGTAGGTIVNDDSVLDLSAVSMVQYEGNGTGNPFVFQVTRTGTNIAASVQWSVIGLTATPATAADFQGAVLPSGTISFAAGQSIAQVTLWSQPDLVVEPDEGFAVLLSSPSAGATIGTAAVAGLIANDDSSLSVTALVPAQAEDAGPARFVITRSGQLGTAATVAWRVDGSGANPADAADFAGGQLPSGIASFAAGQAQATIDIPIAADTAFEPDEGYTLSLSNPVSANTYFSLSLATASASATILNDDSATATLAIAAASAVKREGDSGSTPFTFTVTRAGNTARAVSVGWSATGAATGASANAQDFAGGIVPSGTLSFAAGQTIATITASVAADTRVEPDEGFRIVLSGPSAGAAITTASAAATILNDDSGFSIAANTPSRAEGNSGATPFVFTVTRSGDLSGANSVAWTTAGLAPNSVGPGDFVGGMVPSGTLSFAPGVASQTLTVNVAGDTLVEPDEYFRVALGGATGGAGVTVAGAAARIVNDDTAFAITADTPSQAEGNTGTTDFVFTVTRSGNVGGTHSIGWLATGLGPDSVGPADFAAGTAFAGGLVFLPGETTHSITLAVQGDTLVEPDEHFQVLLRNASAGAAITTNHAEATILNDDGLAPSGAANAVFHGAGAETVAMTIPGQTGWVFPG